MKKRGQISVFIIISLIIIGVIISFFVLKNISFNIFSSDISQIKDYIESCLEDSLIKSLKFFGTQGIIYNNSEDFTNLTYFNIPYYYYEGESRLPTLKEVEDILTNYTISYSNECLDNFENFEERNYKIEKGKKEFLVNIKDKQVNVYLKYPLKIIKGEEVINLENFKAEVDFDFMKVYKILEEFIKEQDKNPDYIPIGYLGVLSYEKNVEMQYAYISPESIIYILIFDELKLINDPYILSFVIKYDFSSLYENENKTEI